MLGQTETYFKTKYATDGLPDMHSMYAPVIFIKDGSVTFPGRAGISMSSLLLRPGSRGTVRIVSADPFAAPEIDLNLFSDPLDLKRIVEGLKLVRKVFKHPAIAPLVGDEIVPGASVVTDQQLEDYTRNYANSGYHHSGTCKMGHRSDQMAVVDHKLKVHSMHGIRVVDASVMPQIISGNVQAAIVVIAEKGAQAITEEYDLGCTKRSSVIRFSHCAGRTPLIEDVSYTGAGL